jgi:hypothetical protein
MRIERDERAVRIMGCTLALLSVGLAASCGGGGSSAPPPVTTISLAPSTIGAGQSSVVTWSATGASECTASGAWTGAVATAGSQNVTQVSAGSYSYTVTCSGAGGSTASSAMLTVQAPTIILSPASVSAQDNTSTTTAQTVVINFTVTNATALLSSGQFVTAAVPNGLPVEYSVTNTGVSADRATAMGTISIQLWAANVLGAGTFQGSVTFTVCHNPSSTAGCAEAVAGSPVNIPVTFTVTGAARSAAIATLNASSLSLETVSTATSGPSENSFIMTFRESLIYPS